MKRNVLIAGFMLTLAAVVSLGASISSRTMPAMIGQPALNDYAFVHTAEPITSEVVVFNSSTIDGAAIADPHVWSGFGDVDTEARAGGRLFFNVNAKGRLEIVPLFTTAGATATIQVFGFRQLKNSDVPDASTSTLVPLGVSGYSLGASYPICRDAGVQTYTLAATAETNKLSINSGQPYPLSSGTTYYVGQRIILDTAGFAAVMPYVVTISGGTLVLKVCAI